MRFIIFCITVCLSQTSLAGEVCQEIPETISYETTAINHDDSIYFKTPKIFTAGKFLELGLRSNTPGLNDKSRRGFCAVLERTYVSSGSVYTSNSDGLLVMLNEKGEFYNMGSATKHIYKVDWIVCK